MLRDVVAQAVRADDVHSSIVEAAVAMISAPLTHRMPMPADVQTLFVQVFDRAAADPSVATIKEVYSLLRGTPVQLVGILSGKVLVTLEEHIFGILRNIGGDTTPLGLYCLAILRVMLATPDEDFSFPVSSYDTQELLASTQHSSARWTPDAVRQFFEDSKAQRTLQLLVLRVMWACTSSTGDLLDERLESLRLANEIIDAVPQPLRDTWRKANHLLVRKLEEKALALDLDPTLRSQCLSFLLQLTKGGFCPSSVMDGLRAVVVRPTMIINYCLVCPRSYVSQLISGGVFDQNTTTKCLQHIVDFATSATPDELVEASRSIQRLLQDLTEALSDCETVVESVMLALDVLSCGEKLQQLYRLLNTGVTVRQGRPASTSTPVCEVAAYNNFRAVVHCLCELFLTASLSQQQSSLSLSHSTKALLLSLFATSADERATCSHMREVRSTAVQTFSFAALNAESGEDDNESANYLT